MLEASSICNINFADDKREVLRYGANNASLNGNRLGYEVSLTVLCTLPGILITL